MNTQAFEECVGPGYSKVKDVYLDKYINMKRELVQLYTPKIDHSCEDKPTICDEIRNSLESNLEDNADLFNLLVDKRKEITAQDGVNRELLDYIVDDFRRDYSTIEDHKEKITKSLLGTVDEIRDYIKSTGLKFNFDWESFDPSEVFLKAGVEQNKRTDNSFNDSMAKEAGAKKLVNYYIANNIIDSSKIDLARMPTEILEDIRKEKGTLSL